ncbi:MAG: VCBS repeat-containing protein, partial [Acidobacteriales bacterium]|nr:VCBS repeat-containing protein [Terriglobales bacterium]
ASVEYPTSSSGLMYASDLNGDGYLDLVVGALEVDVLLGKADGTFSPYTRYIVVGTSGFLLADMNSDGSADVAGADVYGSTLSVLLNARGSRSGSPVSLIRRS